MDPSTLPGMPAPFWFVQLFKVIGFVLHMIPMGLWFAGLPVAIGCALCNGKNSRIFARRMFGQFPIIMALGINFGIVPLLFLQTTYYKSFYTATILMAWHWLAVIPILIVGYYSLYLAAYSREKNGRMILFGVITSLCLISIGILITNGLTLMVRSDLWPGIMERTNHFGATTGLANNMRDPAVWLRFATMFSLGLITTGIWAAFDSHFLMKSNNEPTPLEPGTSVPGRVAPPTNVASTATPPETDVSGSTNAYRRWTLTLSMMLSYGALAIILLVFLGNSVVLKSAYPNFSIVFPLICSQLLLLSFAWSGKLQARYFIILSTLIQVITLATFGIIRQIGQNAGVASYVDVSKIPTAVQWSPLIAFLVCFVAGLGVIAWMIKQCATCPDQAASRTPG